MTSYCFPKDVSSLGVNKNGTRLILAGKQGLYLTDVDKPDKIIKTLTVPNLHSRSSQCIVEWNPHPAKKSVIVSSNGKNIYLWDVEGRSGRSLLSTVESHSRAVQGLSWSSQNPDLFASCSNDTYINVWDTREPKIVQKFKTFCSWTVGASDVKWNRSDENLLASSHAGEVRVWDLRKETTPLTFITAHNSKIYSIDWSYTRANDLLTCGQDKKVKLWTITMPRTTQATLKSQTLLAHAQFLPFGDGIITVCKEEHSIGLWKRSDLSSPIQKFSGNTDILSVDVYIKELDGEINWQVVSLTRENEINIFKIPTSIIGGPDYNSYTNREVNDKKSRSLSSPSFSADMDLKTELKHIEKLSIPGIYILEKSAEKRVCTIIAELKGYTLELRIVFPTMYPKAAPPNFSIVSSNISPLQRTQFIQNINNISQSVVQKSLPCVEQVILHMVEFLEMQQSVEDSSTENNVDIPCPRIAGATFAPNGNLIFFKNLSFSQSSNKQGIPYSYEGLLKYVSLPEKSAKDKISQNAQHSLLSSYYYTEGSDLSDLSVKRPTSFQRETRTPEQTRGAIIPIVKVIDLTSLNNVDKNIGESYQILGDSVEDVCRQNAIISQHLQREDLYKTWTLLGSIGKSILYKTPRNNIHLPRRYSAADHSNESIQSLLPPWSQHPFSFKLIQSLFSHYESIKDVQTLAVMSCVLCLPPNPLRFFNEHKTPVLNSERIDKYREFYTELLYRWGLPEQAAEIKKCIANQKLKGHLGLEFGVVCKHCGKLLTTDNDNCCETCQRRGFMCSLCTLPVRGLSTFCFHCGHGGHTNHMKEWFLQEDVCATGCGCRCLQNHGFILRK